MANVTCLLLDSQLRRSIVLNAGNAKTVMAVVLKQSFMKRQNRSSSGEDAKIGHDMEDPIIQNLCELSRQNPHQFKGYQIESLFKTGLVESKDLKGLRCSPDAIDVMVDDDGNRKVICIEAKCRTRQTTAFQELEAFLPNTAGGENKIFSVSAGSMEMLSLCKRDSELLQMIHQGATLNVLDVLLVVGDKDGNILKVVWVEYTEDLLRAFRKCAKDVLALSTQFIFRAMEESKPIEEVLTFDERKNIEKSLRFVPDLSWEDFIHATKVFLAFMNLNLPLKPSRKLLPYICTLWNRMKNGSDMATQTMRSGWFPLPLSSRLPMAYVSQRIFYLILFSIMKLESVFGFKEGDSLDSWRKRTNKKNGSFRTYVGRLSSEVIIPIISSMQIDERMKDSRAFVHARGDNSANKVSPNSEPSEDSTVPMSSTSLGNERVLRTTRNRMVIEEVSDSVAITGLTPMKLSKSANSKKLSIIERVKKCTVPMGVHCIDIHGKKKVTTMCRRCQRPTSFFCMGCHMYFCPSSTSKGLPENVDEAFKINCSHITAKLGERVTNESVGKKEVDGKVKYTQKKRKKDVHMMFEASCFVIAHQHLLKK